jgi:hypothetical protein
MRHLWKQQNSWKYLQEDAFEININGSSFMKRFTISNLNNLLLLLTVTGFLALFLTLSFNNRLAGDDLYFLAMIKKQGLWECFKGVYMGWSGRWTKTAYWFFVMTLTNYQHMHYVLFAYHLITLLMLVISMQLIIRVLFRELFQMVLTKKDAFMYSMLFTASFYFFTFDIIESWWWIGSTFAYLQGVCFLLAGTALLLKQQKNLFHYCCIGFCFLYVGGCFEIYALIVVGLFATFIVYGKKTGRWHTWKTKGYLKAVLVALSCLLISTLICFIAPGNYQRRDIIILDEQGRLLSSLFKDACIASTFLFQKRWGVAILLSSLWIPVGMNTREQANFHLPWNITRNVLLICLATSIGSVLINEVFKMAILKNALMPSRTFIFTSFSIAIFTGLLFLLTGYYFFQTVKRFALFLPLISCCSMVLLFAYTCKQYGSTTRYAKQYDELINTLVLAKAHGATQVAVQPLPDPGMLLALNVKDLNWALGEILGLKHGVIVIYYKEEF